MKNENKIKVAAILAIFLLTILTFADMTVARPYIGTTIEENPTASNPAESDHQVEGVIMVVVVEDGQLKLHVDTNGDGIPDSWLKFDNYDSDQEQDAEDAKSGGYRVRIKYTKRGQSRTLVSIKQIPEET